MIGALLLAASVAAPGWDAAFSTRGARAPVTVRAVFEDRAGRPHDLTLYRDADRIRRDTAETRIVGQRTGGGETYLIEKVGANLAYRARREDLARLRVFTGWDSLASLLERPRGEVRVEPLARPALKTRFGACRWWAVEGGELRVCWADALKLPLSVEEKRGADWKQTLRIESLHEGRIPAARFALPASVNVVDVADRLEGRDD